jgi:hypothetical protein
MVVVIDGAALLRDLAADFREFFLLFFLLFLLAGIGSLETSDVNFVHLQHSFHHALGAGAIRDEGSDFRHGYSWAEEIISARAWGRSQWGKISESKSSEVSREQKSTSPPCRKNHDKAGAPSVIFPLDGVGIRE